MEDLEQMRQWLLGYPGWSNDCLLYVDYMDAAPESAGLYPKGVQELDRREVILGGVYIRCRYQFTLHRVVAGEGDRREAARWLLKFQSWVREQSRLGLAPRFGDVPNREHIRAERGSLKEVSGRGTVKYAVTLTADFEKKYCDQ